VKKPTQRKRIRKEPAERKVEILRAAHELLIESGYPAFSLRQVALRCNIRLATVQHHFQDRSTLLEELVEFVVAQYTATHDVLSKTPGLGSEERLRHMLKHFLEDNRRPETPGFFVELWAMAHRDEAAARGMARVHRHGIDMLSGLIAAARPELPHAEAVERGVVLVAALDGLLLSLGYGKDMSAILPAKPLDRMTDRLMEIALQDRAGSAGFA
jgi:AcrR family transcriptional regulator